MQRIIYILLLTVGSFFSPSTPAQEIQAVDSPVIIKTPTYVYEENSGLNSLIRYQEERRKKQKRDAMIRIGIGVFFLAVLVVGLARRRARNK